MPSIDILLKNGLSVMLIDPFGRAIGRENQQRDTLETGFSHRRAEIKRRRTGGTDQHRGFSGGLRHSQSHKCSAALISDYVRAELLVPDKCKGQRRTS
ncbi:hypothetical protein FQZ97_952500 [compost metagenome]